MAVIDYHSSNATFYRLKDQNEEWENIDLFKTYIFPRAVLSYDGRYKLPKQTFINQRNILLVKGSDFRDGINGLVMRVDNAAKNFLTTFPDVPWYYRATDDTHLKPYPFLEYLYNLSQVYNPYKHVIAFAATTCIFTHVFLQGGSGWLMSRAMVEYLWAHNNTLSHYFNYSYFQQDDTTMSMILEKLFSLPDTWDNTGNILGSPLRAPMSYDLPNCSKNTSVGIYNNAIAIHIAYPAPDAVFWSKRQREVPDSVGYYHDPPTQKTFLCKITEKTKVYDTSIQHLLDTSEFITIDDLPERLIEDEDLIIFDRKNFYQADYKYTIQVPLGFKKRIDPLKDPYRRFTEEDLKLLKKKKKN